jgi:succinate dehydrogenase / fumarate reductase, cytochrome b subunit
VTSPLEVLKSSIGKKYVMGLTGLFLCVFLVIHLAGNLLLFGGAGPYNEYAHKLHSNEALVKAAEVVLYSGIAIHLYLAFSTAKNNTDARGPVGYEQKKTKIYNRILGIQPESMMFFTGAVVLVFMVVHIYDFKSRDETKYEPFEWAMLILGDMSRKIIYVVGSLFVGVHVAHGFRSAFQSLGINHPKYNRLLDRTSLVFALVVGIGFGMMPVWFGSGSKAPTPTSPPVPSQNESIEQQPAPPQTRQPSPQFRLLAHTRDMRLQK